MSAAKSLASSTRSSGSGRRTKSQVERDERMMRLALRMASRGDGRVHPNPSVGAVVYRGAKRHG